MSTNLRPVRPITCPGCGWTRATRSNGTSITCQRCQHRHYVPAAALGRKGDRPPVGVTCGACDHAWPTRARPQSSIHCPQCGASVWVPVTARTVTDPPPAPPRRRARPAPVRITPTARPAPVRITPPPQRPASESVRPVQPAPARPATATGSGMLAGPFAGLLDSLMGRPSSTRRDPSPVPVQRPTVARYVEPPPAQLDPTAPAPWRMRPAPAAGPAAPVSVHRRPNHRGQCEVYLSGEGPCSAAASGAFMYVDSAICPQHYERLKPSGRCTYRRDM